MVTSTAICTVWRVTVCRVGSSFTVRTLSQVNVWDLAAELVLLPEGGGQQHDQRRQVDDDQPAQGRDQQGEQLQPAVAVEERREPAAGAERCGGGGC
jgi:hypothetical protein